ncbi:MAG TPA: hypothetical protein VEI07_02595 [Planctomycetaceae bacterium]|nr:hypothetical protein [Planctomycetaceae bacterium]
MPANHATDRKQGGGCLNLCETLIHGSLEMKDCAFWRIIAIVFTLAVLYLGHSLQNGGIGGGFSLINPVHAGGVAVQGAAVFTATEDGSKLYVWLPDPERQQVKYIGMCSVNGTFVAAPASKLSNGNPR